MANFIVARGQIEKGKDVVARTGEPYKPKNAAERARLVAAGVLVEAGGKGAKVPAPNKHESTSTGSDDSASSTDGGAFSAEGDGSGSGAATDGGTGSLGT